MSIVMATIQMSAYLKNKSIIIDEGNDDASADLILYQSNNGEYVLSQSKWLYILQLEMRKASVLSIRVRTSP